MFWNCRPCNINSRTHRNTQVAMNGRSIPRRHNNAYKKNLSRASASLPASTQSWTTGFKPSPTNVTQTLPIRGIFSWPLGCASNMDLPSLNCLSQLRSASLPPAILTRQTTSRRMTTRRASSSPQRPKTGWSGSRATAFRILERPHILD